jgi:acyl carrier protein
MLPSDKVDRKKLPVPTDRRFVVSNNEIVEQRNENEKILTHIVAEVLNIEKVSVEDNFFTNLGGHSLLMAAIASTIRDKLEISDSSIRDLYLYPTIAGLSQCISKKERSIEKRKSSEPVLQPSQFKYYACNAFQLVYYYILYLPLLGVSISGIVWAYSSNNTYVAYLRLIGFTMSITVIYMVLPILAKWLLIGRWSKQHIPLWGLKYLKFWIVKQLVQNNPIVFFKGLPIYNWYLRLLGSKIGKDVVIYSKTFTVCTDLINIGDFSILRKDTIIQG